LGSGSMMGGLSENGTAGVTMRSGFKIDAAIVCCVGLEIVEGDSPGRSPCRALAKACDIVIGADGVAAGADVTAGATAGAAFDVGA